MKHNRLQPVHPYPESQERVQPRSHSLGRWRFLPWLICYGFLLLGLSPGVALADDHDKVPLCHVPPGNPADAHTLMVTANAVHEHLKHHPGDHPGPCPRPPECRTNSQCDDANPCTVDKCTAHGTCEHHPVSCDSDNPCTHDVCIPEQGGCVEVPKPGVACNDGDVCTGPDICNDAGTCVGAAIDSCCLSDAACDDNDACTADDCNPRTHTCSHKPTRKPHTPPTPPCQVAVCDAVTGWGTADVTCPNSDICTVSVCDPSIGRTGACVTNPTNPCQNSGVCADNSCTCPAGYTGTYCDIPPEGVF